MREKSNDFNAKSKIENTLSKKRTANEIENAETVIVCTARNSDCGGYRLLYLYGVSVMNANDNERKRIDYRHIICIVITLGFILCGVFLYSGALGRLIEGGRDFGLSVGYYFCEIFGIQHNITPTVNDLPKIPF